MAATDAPPLLVDEWEPVQIYSLLEQSCPVARCNLNRECSMADYSWIDHDSRVIQAERKQWPELLSDINHVELQLRREIPHADETALLIEGVVNATPYGIDCYQWRHGRYQKSRSFGDQQNPRSGLYATVAAWMWSLNRHGVSIWLTPSYVATAATIASFYANSQHATHTTLNRYLRERPTLIDLDPRVNTLINISGAGLGEVRAKSLIALVDNEDRWLEKLITMDEKELCKAVNMGPASVKRFLASVGR